MYNRYKHVTINSGISVLLTEHCLVDIVVALSVGPDLFRLLPGLLYDIGDKNQPCRRENETNARTSSSSPEPNAQRDLNAHDNATVVVIVDGAIKLDFSLAAD